MKFVKDGRILALAELQPEGRPADLAALCAATGVEPVQDSPPPQPGPLQQLVELEPVQGPDGTWRQAWALRPAPDAAQRLADAWARLRRQRDNRLTACDWTQLADAPTDAAAWRTYRQALRDLPAQTADPFAPVWPATPEGGA